jgi:hypothetical protein
LVEGVVGVIVELNVVEQRYQAVLDLVAADQLFTDGDLDVLADDGLRRSAACAPLTPATVTELLEACNQLLRERHP